VVKTAIMRSFNTSKSLAGITAVFLLLVLPLTTPASVARSLTPNDLVAHSAVILVGRCEESRSGWNASRTQIVTRARYTVAQTVKGSAAMEVTVESLGGIVDGVGMYVPGMPSFDPGADEVLFLVPSGSGRFRVAGMAQGKFRITMTSSRTVVSRDLQGLELLGAPDRRLADGQGLASLLSGVRAAMR
jgi:hypothetical protein